MSGFFSFVTGLLVDGYKFIAGVIDFLIAALQVTLWWNVGDINIVPLFMALPVLMAVLILKFILKGGK